jgi:hypothetical protein
VNFRPLALLPLLLASTGANANPAHDALMSMSADGRSQMLSKLLARSGEACPTALRSFHQGSDKSGNAFWNVECSTHQSFIVMVNNDATGSTKILSCSITKTLGLTPCFQKFGSR